MSDARSLLRKERAARKVHHPQASYSSNGTLSCKACRTQIKSDALWSLHLTSPQHVTVLKQLAAGLKAQDTAANAGTKRKAADDDGGEHGEALTLRKRTRPDPSSVEEEEPVRKEARFSEPAKTLEVAAEAPISAQTQTQAQAEAQAQASVSAALNPELNVTNTVDEDEWAAFERDVATPPPPEDHSTLTNMNAASVGATISAAPVTAAELAARSREAASVQAKEQREAEMEGEKEDAQRRLEEEFDQMDELEDRVRRLKEKHEALRLLQQNRQEKLLSHKEPPPPAGAGHDNHKAPGSEPNGGHHADGGDNDDDDDDDDDGDDDDNDNDGWGTWGH